MALTKKQKDDKIKEILGEEYSKIKRFNENGIEIIDKNIEKDIIFLEDGTKIEDKISKKIIDNLDKYPKDKNDPSRTHIILSLKLLDNGGYKLNGIVKNGNEKNHKKRRTYGITKLGTQ